MGTASSAKARLQLRLLFPFQNVCNNSINGLMIHGAFPCDPAPDLNSPPCSHPASAELQVVKIKALIIFPNAPKAYKFGRIKRNSSQSLSKELKYICYGQLNSCPYSHCSQRGPLGFALLPLLSLLF